MIQLLGGVAVAGVVAAGSSAFTAGSGVNNAIVGKSVVGGTMAVAQSVIGAKLTAIQYLGATVTPNQISQIDLTLVDEDAADLPAGSTVTLDITGGGTADKTAVACSLKSASTTVFECKDSTNYWSAVTAVSVTVDTPDLVLS